MRQSRKMNFSRPLILASSSPRRQFLMRAIGFNFEVGIPDIDEAFPDTMPAEEVPSFLAEKKARVFREQIDRHIVLSSDTIVISGNQILNKPVDRADAIRMITMLSGTTHQVVTAFCLLSQSTSKLISEKTDVTFRKLSTTEVETYVDTFQPFDKAGAYGAQECLPSGMNPCSNVEIDFLTKIGKENLISDSIVGFDQTNRVAIIKKIEGSYFNVMGLPIHRVYEHLMEFE